MSDSSDATGPDAPDEAVVIGDPDPSPEPASDPDLDGVDITQSEGPVLEEGDDLDTGAGR